MNDDDFVNKLLNFENLHVTHTEFTGDEKVTLYVESTHEFVVCPDCGQVSNRVHDLSAVQMIRDLSIAEMRCYLSYRAPRFDCQICGKTFMERVDWKRPGLSYTVRYEQYIYQRPCEVPVVSGG